MVANLHEALDPLIPGTDSVNQRIPNSMQRLLLSTHIPFVFGLALLGCTTPAALPPVRLSLQKVTAISPRVSRTESEVPPARGVPFGPWSIPPHLIGPLYNGGVLTGHTPFRQLDEVRARKGQVVLYLARKKSQEHGTISVAAVERFLETWPDISSYIRDGTVWGIMISDDITGKQIWGPGAPYFPQIDSIAKLVTDRWPEARTIVRAPPTNMVYPWKWVRWAWSQYSHRNGEVTEYRDRQLAKADSLGLCLVFGLNVINGGEGSSGVGPRRRRHRNRMSGAEILKYYSALLPHTPVAFHWEYRPEVEADPEIRAAMEKVRAWADTTPQPSCRHD
jgi:hypothetical protein